jgi:uncharacterized membrane protein YfcA
VAEDDRTFVTNVVLFVAGLVGGALNAVAGGGSFIALPALLSAGVAPVAANATTTLALWPGSLSSAIAYRREITTGRRWLVWLAAVSIVGGLLGGWLLIRTPDQRFLRVLPWLMLASATTFTIGGRVTSRLLRRGTGSAPVPSPQPPAPFWFLIVQLAIATYGGYFAGGIGIMMLAAFSIAGMTEIHEMNGLKALLSVAINGVSLVEFIASGSVAWPPGLVMVMGGIIGGYSGAFVARRFDAGIIRTFVICVAWIMTIYFFVR